MVRKGSVSAGGRVQERSFGAAGGEALLAAQPGGNPGRTACAGAERCQAYVAFLETLTPANVTQLSRLAAPNMRFRDPIHDVRGVENVKRVYAGLFDMVDDPRFTVTHCACADEVCFLRWHFTCRPRIFGKGHPWIVDAVTVLHFDAQGRVAEQVDYWDAGQYMYERFRFIGPVFRFFRKRRMRAG